MKRKMLDELITWKASKNRKPLILEGARQVGKTYLLKEVFGAGYFENMVHVNLQNPSRELIELFDGAIDPKRIITAIELLYGIDIYPEKTLLIFDEIQEVPHALTALKYFCEDAPEYCVAAAGSLLGIFLHEGTSFPVGKVNTLKLEPMDFEEFLWANDREKLTEYKLAEPDDIKFTEILSDLLKEYMFVGGMPEAVQNWVNEHSVEEVEKIQESIVTYYRRDFSKHTDGTTAIRIRQVFDSLPAQFAKRNDKFFYGLVRSGARAREYEMAIEWLIDAGIVRRVTKVSRGDKLPLKAYEDRQSFKLYFVDLGLFRHLANIPSGVIMTKNAIFNEFNGLVAEQYVLQQLPDFTLYCWISDSESEVDFVTQIGDNIVPIEVKSGENVHAKSLKVYREKYKPTLAVRFSLRERELNAGLLNIPLYESFLFTKLVERSRIDSF
jgi:predicted AAA+ superfamily ATPase